MIFLFLFFTVIAPAMIYMIVMATKTAYFNDHHFMEPRDEVFLSFKDFIDFYSLNPDRYAFDYDFDGSLRSVNIQEEYESYDLYSRHKCMKFRNKYKVKFKLFSYIRFYYWDKHRQKVKKKHKYNEDMRGMLELVQKDIDSIRERAKKEVREAERITNEVGGRCKNATY